MPERQAAMRSRDAVLRIAEAAASG